jgi:diguanylate cyclase (GGDEF)-like protein
MSQSHQALLQIAREKLANSRYTPEQREQTLRLLDLLLELAGGDEKNEDYARATAKIMANVTRHHNLFALIQQQAAELEALKRISVNLTSSLQLQAVLDRVATEAMQLIKNAHGVHIFLYENGILRFGAALDFERNRNRIFSLPRPDGLTYTVARTKQTILVDDMNGHPLFKTAPGSWKGAIVGIPLKNDEAVIGVMNMALLPKGKFSPSELRLLDLLASQAAVAIINARLHQSMSKEAMSDMLTGLPNRRALDARLENEVNRAERYGHQFAVLMMDLDGFKAINDTYGHDIGDRVLHDFAQFLSESKRSSDFLARYGGDEMTMIMPETDGNSAAKLAEKIKQRMETFEPVMPDGAKPKLGISGGIALYPQNAKTASDLLRSSDEALYRAKRHARGSFLPARPGTGELSPIKNLK